MLRTAAAFSGGAVSPARALGPAIVFHCHWNKVWIYVLGEIAGCVVAGILACPLYGGHAKYLDPLIRAPLPTCSNALLALTHIHAPLAYADWCRLAYLGLIVFVAQSHLPLYALMGVHAC